MASIYGDILVHFSEQFVTTEYFVKEPIVGAGLKTQSSGTCRLILQSGEGMQILGSSGRLAGRSNWRVLDYSDNEFIWVRKDSPIQIGYYIIHPKSKELYAVVRAADWDFYAGFNAFQISRVQGKTDDKQNTTINKGEF